MALGGAMKPIKRAVHRGWPILLLLVVLVTLACPRPVMALEEVIVSYAGPTVTFLPAEVARQRGFMREQNLDLKLLLTRSEVDRAALVSGSVDYRSEPGRRLFPRPGACPCGSSCWAQCGHSGAWSFDRKSKRLPS